MGMNKHDVRRNPIVKKAFERQRRLFWRKTLTNLAILTPTLFIFFAGITLSITMPNKWEFVSAVACILTGMIICFLAARFAFDEQIWPTMVNTMSDAWEAELSIRSLNEEIEELKSQLTDPEN